jgi:hypothetical protein
MIEDIVGGGIFKLFFDFKRKAGAPPLDLSPVEAARAWASVRFSLVFIHRCVY